MGLVMLDGAVYRALQFKTYTTIWCAIGRTTAWVDEETPPQEDPTAHDIEEVIAYVKPYHTSIAKPVLTGEDVSINGLLYAFVADEDALADQDARFLYIAGEFNPNSGTAYGNFRQIAVYADLVPDTGHMADDWLNPADVSDPGTLCYLHNDTVTAMSPTRRQVIELVLEFK